MKFELIMSKPIVERAPSFDYSEVDLEKIKKYLKDYDATDEKGRYLHWNVLKWRLPKAEAKDIWMAIKLKRSLGMKITELKDDKDNYFSYSIPHSMEAKLHQIIEIAGGNVAAIADSSASNGIQQRYLVSSLIMEEAITSAQLEGAATTREVAKKMLEEEREPHNEDERMVLNNYFLLKHAEKVAKEDLTVDLILDFHNIATQFTTENNVVPGEFREDNDIFVEDGRGEIAHQPPCFKLLQERLQALCLFVNGDHSGKAGEVFIPPVIKAIIIHFMLGYEHPFRDGNGRTARALFYWYMLKNDYELFRYISISKLLKDNAKGYGLSYMYTEKDQNDMTYFIDFQLDMILAAFDELQTYLETKTEEFQQVLQILDNSKFSNTLNFVQKDILKKATKEPGRVFTVKEISSSYSIADNTSRNYLKELVSLKLLLSAKDARTFIYISPADLMERLTRS